MARLEKNAFFDINKLPTQEGLLVFPISMSRISNAQTAKKCWEYVRNFTPGKIVKPVVGLNIIYADTLYFLSKEPAYQLKRKYDALSLSHKQELLGIVAKNPMYIEKAFAFSTWNQALLECKDFQRHMGTLRKLAKTEKGFRQALANDAKAAGKPLDDLQTEFFLEENLLFYMIVKGGLRLRNDYVQGHEKWVLYCYPGKPLQSQAYLFQHDPIGLKNSKNEYEHHFYDLSERKLYDLKRMDLKAWPK